MIKNRKLTEWQEEALLAIREFTRRRHRAIMPEEFEEIMFPAVYKRGKSRGLVGLGIESVAWKRILSGAGLCILEWGAFVSGRGSFGRKHQAGHSIAVKRREWNSPENAPRRAARISGIAF